jgi:hypothetical protein
MSDFKLPFVTLQDLEDLRNHDVLTKLEDEVTIEDLCQPRLFEIVSNKSHELLRLVFHLGLALHF